MSGAKISEQYAAELARQVDELEAENAELRARPAWRKIETAPKDGTPILALYDSNLFYEHVVCWWGRDPTYPWDSKGNAFPEARITHWMPLPEPPK